MSSDEQQIRSFLPEWFDATSRGDIQKLLSMLTDDVLFLTANSPPMNREQFEKNFLEGSKTAKIDCEGEFEEVVVVGDVTYTRGKIQVTVSPNSGGQSMRLAGYTMTVFRKVNGKWLLARDANFLKPMSPP